MGDATYHVKKREEHCFTIRNPTPTVELQKAIHWATQEFERHRGRPVQFDDDLMVESVDERITVFFWVVLDG